MSLLDAEPSDAHGNRRPRVVRMGRVGGTFVIAAACAVLSRALARKPRAGFASDPGTPPAAKKPPPEASQAAPGCANFESAQTHTIRLSPDSLRRRNR